MRKIAVEALNELKALGFKHVGFDGRGHAMLHHPGLGLDTRMSMSPSDRHGPVAAVRTARELLGLPTVKAKRRASAVRSRQAQDRVRLREQAESRQRKAATAEAEAERSAARRRRDADALRILAAREAELNGIRGLMGNRYGCRGE